jgi:hypothetical protein
MSGLLLKVLKRTLVKMLTPEIHAISRMVYCLYEMITEKIFGVLLKKIMYFSL